MALNPPDVLGSIRAAHNFLSYNAATVPDLKLKAKFTKYWDSAAPGSDGILSVSLILASGLGLASELWIPFIRRVFELQNLNKRPVKVMSIWTIDFANHGDAASLNADALATHFSKRFPTEEKTIAVDAFLASDMLSTTERANLVAVGHSGGGGGAFCSTLMMAPGQTSPFKTVILVEPPVFSQDMLPVFDAVVNAIGKFNRMKPDFWENVDEAMEFFQTFPPTSTFHKEVLEAMKATGFRRQVREVDGEAVTGVTTKMPIAQETASFAGNGKNINTVWENMRTTFIPEKLVSLHVIMGSTPGFGPKPLARSIARNITSVEGLLASLSVIQGADHYVPQQKPYELAARVVEIVNYEHRQAVTKL